MKFIVKIHPGEEIPWTHRTVYYDHFQGDNVAMPIGIHWIAKTFRCLWHWTYKWRPTAFDKACINFNAKHAIARHEELGELRQLNHELLEACITAVGAYEALKLTGADKYLPGFDSCLQDLKAAIKKGQNP